MAALSAVVLQNAPTEPRAEGSAGRMAEASYALLLTAGQSRSQAVSAGPMAAASAASSQTAPDLPTEISPTCASRTISNSDKANKCNVTLLRISRCDLLLIHHAYRYLPCSGPVRFTLGPRDSVNNTGLSVAHCAFAFGERHADAPQFSFVSAMKRRESASDPIEAIGPNKASLAFVLWPTDDLQAQEQLQTGHPPAPQTAVAAVGRRPRRLRECSVDGCTKRAKFHKKCWRHGGSVQCQIADCPNRAKTRGLCWSHGGGTVCSVASCRTIAVSNGVCWAHGGGKRCEVIDCTRAAYGSTENLCRLHYQQMQDQQGSSSIVSL